jgi:phasin family protein
MSTLTEQFSAVRKSQVEAQINFFQNFAAKAVESAQKFAALNLTVSRASMEKSSAAMAELLEAKDPRDLFALTKRTQETIDGLLAYNRELLAIATGASTALAQTAVAASPKVNTTPLALATPAPAETPRPELPVAEFVAPLAPEAKAKPIAKAVVKQVEAKPVVVKAVEAKPVVVKAVAVKPVVVKPVEAKPVEVKAVEAKPVEAKAVEPTPVAAKAVEPKPVAAPAAVQPPVVTKPVEAAAPAPVSAKPAAAQQQLDLPATKAKKKK